MYFPKTQIKTNLQTSGGEFKIESTNEEYKGFYFQTSTGDFYTGKNPNDSSTLRLISYTSIKKPTNETSLSEISNPLDKKLTEWTYDYFASPLSNKLEQISPSQPIRIYPQPTESDYKLGEFQRYFLSKTNEPKFIEVNKEQYQKYVNRDEMVAYQLYEPITLPWDITGDRNQVYNTNKNIVGKSQRDNRLRGFTSYFKERYDQFYK
jgi:hypothetical protein